MNKVVIRKSGGGATWRWKDCVKLKLGAARDARVRKERRKEGRKEERKREAGTTAGWASNKDPCPRVLGRDLPPGFSGQTNSAGTNFIRDR